MAKKEIGIQRKADMLRAIRRRRILRRLAEMCVPASIYAAIKPT